MRGLNVLRGQVNENERGYEKKGEKEESPKELRSEHERYLSVKIKKNAAPGQPSCRLFSRAGEPNRTGGSRDRRDSARLPSSRRRGEATGVSADPRGLRRRPGPELVRPPSST